MGVERVFRKYPFVYLINDTYYAFGQGVCAPISSNLDVLSQYYNNYVLRKNNSDLSNDEAQKIYRALKKIAEKEKNPLSLELSDMLIEKFERLELSDNEIQELEAQIDSFEIFFKNNNIRG